MKLSPFSLCLALLACRSNPPETGVKLAEGSGVVGAGSKAAIANAEAEARKYAPADVEFMQGMVPHHAQAIIMSRWAVARTSRHDIRVLAEKIINAQTDEIRSMRRWLAERGEEVPDSNSTRHRMKMNGMVHEMLMPGMLNDEEMAELDKARGKEFEKQFLNGMIYHHLGAIGMVRELLSHGDAGHDDTVFRFAGDVEADQSAEVHRMRLILEAIGQ
jgi:uncharacterized protein (DUF305 family)